MADAISNHGRQLLGPDGVGAEKDFTFASDGDQHSVLSVCCPHGDGVVDFRQIYTRAMWVDDRHGGEHEHRNQRKHDACKCGDIDVAD
jgi:hypothetical protein